jgi:hypothetical protein
MALQGSGAISIGNVSVELGRSSTATTSLGETDSRSLAGIVSGAISLADFYNKFLTFVFTQTISADTANYNLKSAAIAGGWNQTTPLNATVTINNGVYVYSTSTGSYAFDTGSTFPTNTTLALINNGAIVGRGGNGGAGGGDTFNNGSGNQPSPINGAAGSAAGPAFIARYAISVTNNAIISGGGGGGGGGGSGNS